jgi:hypothetical protein
VYLSVDVPLAVTEQPIPPGVLLQNGKMYLRAREERLFSRLSSADGMRVLNRAVPVSRGLGASGIAVDTWVGMGLTKGPQDHLRQLVKILRQLSLSPSP